MLLALKMFGCLVVRLKMRWEKDSAYLLSIDPDRLLHRFFENAGLQPKGDVYGGWESEGLSGHTMGHYLSACSMMYASTSDGHFLTRVNYLVGPELAICQDARKTGYVGAIPRKILFSEKLARKRRNRKQPGLISMEAGRHGTPCIN